MGSVDVGWRRESGFERLVAIKRLHPHFSEDRELVTMLHDEARVAGTIRHANVVGVLDVGEDAQGTYLVMELVEGQSLAQLLAHTSGDGVLPLQIALRIIRHIAAGLHAAHETRDSKGEPLFVVHRDVSPQNILVGYDGVARITDFGVAKALGARTQTEAGLVKGKLRYMAPEQLSFKEIDRRSDIFALGVVLYEVVAGHHPFRGTSEEIARAVAKGVEPPDLGEECPELPSALVELVFRMLAHDPALRPADAGEIVRALDALLVEEVSRDGVFEISDYLMEHFRAAREELSDRIRIAASASSTETSIDDQDEPSLEIVASSGLSTRIETPRSADREASRAAERDGEPASASPSRRVPWEWITMGLFALALAVLAAVTLYASGTASSVAGEGARLTPEEAAGVAAVAASGDATPEEPASPEAPSTAGSERGPARGEGGAALVASDESDVASSPPDVSRGRRPARRSGRRAAPHADSTPRVGAWSWDHEAH